MKIFLNSMHKAHKVSINNPAPLTLEQRRQNNAAWDYITSDRLAKHTEKFSVKVQMVPLLLKVFQKSPRDEASVSNGMWGHNISTCVSFFQESRISQSISTHKLHTKYTEVTFDSLINLH